MLEQQEVITSQYQDQHGEDEQVQVREELIETWIIFHVSNREQMN